MNFFSSFNSSYFSRALVLGESIKKHHSQSTLWAIIVERKNSIEIPGELYELYDEIIYAEDLFNNSFDQFVFGLNVVEACTAVKGAALNYILEQGANKVIYLDPDIVLFNPLSEVEKLLESYSIILTPHQLDPEDEDDALAIIDNEICSLIHGAFNLGFLAISNCHEAKRFTKWWSSRLSRYCHDKKIDGLFVDQKWCDLVPSFFEDVIILRNPGYNVASWNLSKRLVSFKDDGNIYSNDVPLIFYHFTKLGPIGFYMTERYCRNHFDILEVWAWYNRTVESKNQNIKPNQLWSFGSYDDHSPIDYGARILYRTREDLREAFPNPFECGIGSYKNWHVSNK